jgi:hypothetical protein
MGDKSRGYSSGGDGSMNGRYRSYFANQKNLRQFMLNTLFYVD